jgi:hypothetical protein
VKNLVPGTYRVYVDGEFRKVSIVKSRVEDIVLDLVVDGEEVMLRA